MDTTSFDMRREMLRGLELTHVWRGFSTALFLEFGRLSLRPPFRGRARHAPEGEMGVGLSWSWRIEGPNTILCGSETDPEDAEETLVQLIGARVVDIALFARLPELAISLSNDIHILTFATQDDGPDWAIFTRTDPGKSSNSLAWKNGALAVQHYAF